MATRDAAIAEAAQSFDDGRFIADLARRVAMRTESQDPDSGPKLDAYLRDEIAPCLARLGYDTEILPNPHPAGGPFLIAERHESADRPTVLTYGHGDTVLGLDAAWHDGLSPWQLTVVDDRLYGRGVADNKGQHSINIAALAAVIAARGRLGFNSKILIETSEETGSLGLRDFTESQTERLSADLFLASDGPRLRPDRPTVFLGARGALNLDFAVSLRAGGHHSGNWGGVLANPGVILAHALASIIDRQGRVLVRELVPRAIPNSVRAALADCAIDPGPDGPAIDADWGEPGLTPAERVFAWNTFEILSFRTGNPDNPVNAVPPSATAHCQIRFTVDTDPATFVPALRRHLDANGYPEVEVAAADRSAFAATRLDPSDPWVDWALRSVEATTGQMPVVLPNLGGSLPNDCFADVLGLPTIWVPHSYAGCSQHAANEHGLIPIMREGLQIMTGLFWDLGEASSPL